jgi:hypothetical protein
MKFRYLAATALTLASAVFALEGEIGIHDPSTIIQCAGKYYTYLIPDRTSLPNARQSACLRRS